MKRPLFRTAAKLVASAVVIFFLMNRNRVFTEPVHAGWLKEMKLLYVAAIVIVAAVIRLSLSKSPVPAMAAMLVIAGFYTRFGRGDLFSFLSFLLFSIALYFIIRSRIQRNEMFELNKRHLAELQVAYEQLQEASVTAMQVAVLEERTRIARDIHDAVGHSLTSVIVQLQALQYMIPHNSAQAQQTVEGMLDEARHGLQEIRSSVHALADDPSIFNASSLRALLSRMESTASIRCSFYNELGDEEGGEDVYGTFFRVLQEAITNVVRHSQATQLEVWLKREAGHIVMRIRDNGILHAGDRFEEGFGMRVMKARLQERGGGLVYSILNPHGLEIVAELPAAASESNEGNERF